MVSSLDSKAAAAFGVRRVLILLANSGAGQNGVEMFDKLQFVADFCHSPTAENPDKLMVFEN
jgi:hypothetical protein